MLARAKGKRGSVRVRYCIEWSDRSRLLKYPTSIGMTFVVPFKQNNFMRDAEFAVQGRFDNPAKFDGKIFATHLRDLKTIVENCLEVRGKNHGCSNPAPDAPWAPFLMRGPSRGHLCRACSSFSSGSGRT